MRIFFATTLLLFWHATTLQGLSFTTNCPQSYTCDITQGIFTIKCAAPCSTQTGANILALPIKSQVPDLSFTLSIIGKGNLLQRLPTNLCLYGSQLRILDLSSNAISETLTPTYFSCLVQIETLILANNFIDTINPNTFDGLDNLKSLDLSFNIISSLPAKLFVLKLPALQSLKLQNNKLTEIDVWFFYLKSINYINLSYNKIAQFRNSIGWTPRSTDTLTQLLGSQALIDMSFNK
jgi:Leucine-rich repeat (LRR) protein